jgi:long-chain acyl-CoA synthetase
MIRERAGGSRALPSTYRTPSVCVSPPDWPYSPLAVDARGWLQWPLFGLLDLVVRTEVSGLDRLEAIDQPALFVANHTSHLDTLVVLRALPDRWRRRMAVAAAQDYFFSHALVGALVGLGVGAFPVARAGDGRPVVEHCARLRERGWSMMFFPEGTRSTTGQIGPLKHGAGLIALKLGLPIVPIRTRGLFEAMPKGRLLPRPGRASIQFGTPIDFGPSTPMPHVTASIAAALNAL